MPALGAFAAGAGAVAGGGEGVVEEDTAVWPLFEEKE
jgi:hypothetical protein